MPRSDVDQHLITSLGARIAEVRRATGMTQAAVAEAAGLDPQSYQRAETGRSALSLVRIGRIATALGVAMPALFAAVGADVPESPWRPMDVEAATIWSRIPTGRRELALRLLAELARP